MVGLIFTVLTGYCIFKLLTTYVYILNFVHTVPMFLFLAQSVWKLWKILTQLFALTHFGTYFFITLFTLMLLLHNFCNGNFKQSLSETKFRISTKMPQMRKSF